MKYIVGFGQFWYDFVVGEDWTVAAGVIAALAVTALIVHNSSVAIWWLLPVAVAIGLFASVWRVARK